MRRPPLQIVILGLSITSSWGNGHATTYRGLVRELVRRGNHVLFLERDVPWYASNRDMPVPPYGKVQLYSGVPELRRKYLSAIRQADAVIVGSYVPEGQEVGELVHTEAGGVTAFYDIDTPVTLAAIRSGKGQCEYLSASQIRKYQLYLSFTGGPILKVLTDRFGAPIARPLYCSFDPEIYHPEPARIRWDIGYMGTYSADRQPRLDRLLLGPARRANSFKGVVAGPMYPNRICWPANIERIQHLAPGQHREFYNSQRFTLNITREDMVRAGYSPSVRLFEAAACGVPIITDEWNGLSTFFTPGREILIARSGADVLHYLRDLGEPERRSMGSMARRKVLAQHTAAHRAQELESFLREAMCTSKHLRRSPARSASLPAAVSRE